MFSYVFASDRFVQPCQIRAIICHMKAERDRGAPFDDIISSKTRSTSKNKKTRSHSHYLITAIDIDDLAGYRRGSITGEKTSGGA